MSFEKDAAFIQARTARIKLAQQLINWKEASGNRQAYEKMADYLDLRSGDDWLDVDNWNSSHTAKCQLLLGEHGYTLYKAWLVRKGL